MPSHVVLNCGKRLAENKLTIAFAESATAGRMAAEFALVPESGIILKGGLVCYDASLKQTILGVPASLIKTFTPESAEVTEALAAGLGRFISSSIQVAVTGLTTPGGSETTEKPVGTIFIHARINGKSVQLREVFKGSPESIILQAIDRAAELILQEIGEPSL